MSEAENKGCELICKVLMIMLIAWVMWYLFIRPTPKYTISELKHGCDSMNLKYMTLGELKGCEDVYRKVKDGDGDKYID